MADPSRSRAGLTVVLTLAMLATQVPSFAVASSPNDGGSPLAAVVSPPSAALLRTARAINDVAPLAMSTAITIGQVGPAQPNSAAQSCTACTTLQSGTDPASPSYAAPADGTITSWSVQGPTDVCSNCSVQLRIFRRTASGEFLTVAQSDVKVIDTGLKTFPAIIPVLAGDILGINATNGLRWYSGNAGDRITFIVGDPLTGTTTTGPCPTSGSATNLCRFDTTGSRLNIAATEQVGRPVVSGVVTNDLKQPMANVLVRLERYPGDPAAATTLTDLTGAYSVTIGSPDKYEAVFVPPAGSGFAVQVYSDRVSTATATPVPVAYADVPGINAVLHRAYPVSGRVTDSAGASLAGVVVQAYLGTGGGCCYTIRDTTTNADGFYSIELLPGYDYKLRFAPGTTYEQWWNGHNNPTQDVVAGWTSADPITLPQFACSGSPVSLFDNWNKGGVGNGGQSPSFSTNGAAYCLTELDDYHWNNGLGATPGTIALTSTSAKPLGPFAATGTVGSNNVANANWTVQLAPSPTNIVQGSYSCTDSDPATWAQNGTSVGLGFCRVLGIPYTAVGRPNTNATLTRNQITGIARCVSGATTYTLSSATLRSGTTSVATQSNLVGGAFAFAGTAANATYGLDYVGYVSSPTTDFQRKVSCSVNVSTDANGAAIAPAGSIPPDLGNHTFLTARPITSGVGQLDFMAVPGRPNWYRIVIAPGQRLTVAVNGGGANTPLPVDLVLTLYGDIKARQAADRAALAGSTDPLAAIRRNDAGVAPDGLSPDGLSPDGLSPDGLSPDGLSPDGLSPDGLSPDGLSPDGLSPDGLSPDGLSPDGLSPDGLSPDGLSSLYTSAQTESLLRVSDKPGTQPEMVTQNTWSNSGTYYIRVRGHNAAFSASTPYTVTAMLAATSCGNVTLTPSFAPTTVATAGGFKTIIVTNTNRFGPNGTPLAAADASSFRQTLTTFAARPEIQGKVIDFATSGPAGAADSGVAAAYAQWYATSSSKTCPAAANIVASTIKGVIDAYGALNPALHYVVIAGSDAVIPFLRVPDQAGLGNESGYQPPVAIDTPSNASLRFGYVLSDGFYGSTTPIARYDHLLYLMDRPTGRLVETPADITTMITAYSTGYDLLGNGDVIKPTSALVTGYDFLADTAQFMAQQWTAGQLTVDQSLISTVWTAADLGAKLLGPTRPNYSLVALNGHFSANTALAADFATRLRTADFTPFQDGRFRNMLIVSSGCHSGFNIIDDQGILNVTQPLDWPQLFNGKGATLIGGTGYQYGDTDFRKYTELILSNFSQELRYGSGAVAVGEALANAKFAYLAQVASLSGTDEKALVESTLYGLPMFTVDLPAAGRLPRPGAGSGIATVAGSSSGLSVASIAPVYTLTQVNKTLTTTTGTQVASYYDASYAGVTHDTQTTPGSQILPRVVQNVHVDGRAARGVVLDRATFTNRSGFFVLTDNAAIEAGGSRAYFTTPVATPVVPFTLNTFVGENLILTPAQFRSTPAGSPTGVERTLDTQTVRVYYSSLTDARAFVAAPVIYSVNVGVNPVDATKVDVDVTVGGSVDPGCPACLTPVPASDFIETVLATFTQNADAATGSWSSIDLTGQANTSNDGYHFVRHYTGTIQSGPDGAGAVRLFIQAVGGNALVSRATNNGAYYAVAAPTAPTVSAPLLTSTLSLSSPPSSGYRSTLSVSATLTRAGGAAVAGKPVSFTFNGPAPTSTTGFTDGYGVARAYLRPAATPGSYSVSATFAGDAAYLGSSDQQPVTVTKAVTSFGAAVPVPSVTYSESAVIATLRSGGRPLQLEPITITLGTQTVLGATDGFGRVRLNTLDLAAAPSGLYTVAFNGDDLYQPASLAITVPLTPEAATVNGSTLPPQALGSVIGLSATVQEVPHSTSGDITKAQVAFDLVNEAGTIVSSVTAPVRSDGSVAATITPTAAGLYHVNTTVVGGFYTSPTTFTILVVYDPSRFATGGGWILTTRTSTGLVSGRKANFGFTAKYLSGSTTPSGSVEFNAKESGVVFKATSFAWLVISGGRAELQGGGTINGTGSYTFRLSAVQGPPDTFEIRIWTATGSFDAPTYWASGSLGGGNIVIH